MKQDLTTKSKTKEKKMIKRNAIEFTLRDDFREDACLKPLCRICSDDTNRIKKIALKIKKELAA